jgi:hypothetical protein
MPEIDLTEAERKLIRKLEKDEKRLRINYSSAICLMIVCLVPLVLGFVWRNKGLVYMGLFGGLSAELMFICIRNNSRHFRLIKKLLKDEESSPKPSN